MTEPTPYAEYVALQESISEVLWDEFGPTLRDDSPSIDAVAHRITRLVSEAE